jgi:hypothetical protein
VVFPRHRAQRYKNPRLNVCLNGAHDALDVVTLRALGLPVLNRRPDLWVQTQS